jgi:hypothetical protein
MDKDNIQNHYSIEGGYSLPHATVPQTAFSSFKDMLLFAMLTLH